VKTEILKALQDLKNDPNIDNGIFATPQRLLSALNDTLAQKQNAKKLKNLLRIAIIDMEACQKLSSTKDNFVVNNLINEMNTDFSILKNDAIEVICAIAEFLGADTSGAIQVQQTVQQPITQQAVQQVATMQSVYTKNGNKVVFGGYTWLVLEESADRMLILTEDVIETQKQYHSEYVAITWADCDLNKYLNNEFYNRFNAEDKKRILVEPVVTNKNPWYGTDGGRARKDPIFLLSIEEVVKYFGDSGQLKKGARNDGCIDDQYNKERIAYDKGGEGTWWWLRSPW